MFHHFRTKVLVVAVVTVWFLTTSQAWAQMHPGPRATCPTCNARMLEEMIRMGRIPKPVSRGERIRLVERYAPAVNAIKVEKILANMDSIPVSHLQIHGDTSFETFRVEFNNNSKAPFVVKNKNGTIIYSGKSAQSAFKRIDAMVSDDSKKAYVFVDDIASKDAQNLISNAKTYRASTDTTIETFITDVYLDGNNVRRYGEPLFAPKPKVTARPSISKVKIGKYDFYTATVNFAARAKNTTLKIYAKTREILESFLEILRSTLSRADDISMAMAINRSRARLAQIFPDGDKQIVVFYDEIGVTQKVEIRRDRSIGGYCY